MKINRPSAPKGYRLLKDGIDTNQENDYAWMIAPDDLCYEWTSAKYGFANPRHPAGNGKTYIEPKKASDWFVFRCRKLKKK